MAKTKLKTNRGAAKRFSKTGKGGFKRGSAFKRHILTKKSAKRIRNLRGPTAVHASDVREVRQLLPNA
jgi:large subunit ribosomal protein L35